MRKRVLLILALVCVVLSPFASSLPDGLETVIDNQSLSTAIQELSWPLFSEYQVAFVSHPYVTSWLAGAIGMLITALGITAIFMANRVKLNLSSYK